jgi:E3 ubiquitin-protein ligase RBBP6
MRESNLLDSYKRHYVSSQPGEEAPSTYRCHKCNTRGHFIKDCPVQGKARVMMKGCSGIPRTLLEKVTDYRLPGAMFSPTGECFVRTLDM